MPTIRIAFIEAWDGGGTEGAWTVSIAQQETLILVLDRVDPALTITKAGPITATQGGGAVDVVSKAFAATERLRGMVATSDRAVRWGLVVNGVEKVAWRTEVGQPSEPIMLPGSLVAGAVTVKVTAQNESDQGDAVCDAALLSYVPAV